MKDLFINDLTIPFRGLIQYTDRYAKAHQLYTTHKNKIKTIVAHSLASVIAHHIILENEQLNGRLYSSPSLPLPLAGSGGSREAAVLLGIMGCTTLAGAIVGTGLLLAIATHSAGLAWKILALSGALLLGSLGLQVRAPMLLVPPSMGPLAVLVSTICGFAGEFAGPLIAGVIKDWYAPNCAVIDLGDGSSGVGPLCASPADQHGLLLTQ